MSEPTSFPAHHSFQHEAMMTTFHLRICGEDEKQIRGLACECFLRIDELEQNFKQVMKALPFDFEPVGETANTP